MVRATVLLLLFASAGYAQHADVLLRSNRHIDNVAVLFQQQPRVGLYWTSNNPAGLAWETAERFTELGLFVGNVEGEYRRALDPGAAQARGARGIAWQTIGERTGVFGIASYTENVLDPGSFATTIDPYTSSPFVITDSTSSPQRSTNAHFTGAAGWQLGEFAVGLKLGYEAVESRTTEARAPRFGRRAERDIVLGAARGIAGDALRVGIFARLVGNAETTQIFGATGATLVTRLNGFRAPQQLFVQNLASAFYKRREADERQVGISLDGNARGWRWIAHGRVGDLVDEQWSQRINDPARDRWDAQTRAAGVALQRSLSAALNVAAGLQWARLDGDAQLADSTAIIYIGTEDLLGGTVDVGIHPSQAQWRLRITAGIDYERSDRGDPPGEAALRTNIKSLNSRLAVEIERDVVSDVAIIASYGLTNYAPSGSVPRSIHYPAAIRNIAGRDASFNATPSMTHAGGISLLWQRRPASTLRFGLSYERAAPRSEGVVFDLMPEGTRTRWMIMLASISR